MRQYGVYVVWLAALGALSSLMQVLIRWGGKRGETAITTSHFEWLWASRWWLLGIGGGWVCGLAWAWILRKVPLNIAWPTMTGFMYVLTVVWSYWLLHEKVRPIQLAGIMVTLVGVLLILCPSK